jgi:hypothetical protein
MHAQDLAGALPYVPLSLCRSPELLKPERQPLAIPITLGSSRQFDQCTGHRFEPEFEAEAIVQFEQPSERWMRIQTAATPFAGVYMPTITTDDGVEIFYKDWGSGQPIVFSHGWPLSADDWDSQLLFFLNHGYRVIAHDRRGHGRSTQTADGHDMDHYADDLAALTAYLDLKSAIHVGHSTGGGEVAHYLGRHGESRLKNARRRKESYLRVPLQ